MTRFVAQAMLLGPVTDGCSCPRVLASGARMYLVWSPSLTRWVTLGAHLWAVKLGNTPVQSGNTGGKVKETMDPRVVDLSDREIVPGCYVCYAALWSRSAMMKFGRVTRLGERKRNKWDAESKSDPVVVVVTVDRTYARDPNTGRCDYNKLVWELQAKGREITLSFPERMIVVDESRVPGEARDLLDAAFTAKHSTQ